MVSTANEIDEVKDPRPLPGQNASVWQICPACRTPENLSPVCDHIGCDKQVSNGALRSDGSYRNTCSGHYRTMKTEEEK